MADKMLKIAGRSEEGVAKAIQTDSNGKIMVVDSNKSKTIKTKQVTFSGKTVGVTYDVPHIAKSVVNNALATPDEIKGLGAGEVSQLDYNNISSENLVTRNSVTSSVGKMQIMYFLIDVLSDFQKTKGVKSDVSIGKLRNIIKKITLSYKGYGVGDNSGTRQWGLTLKAYNKVTSTWDVIGSNISSEPTYILSQLSSSNYIDDTGFIYVAVTPTYTASATNPSGNYTDFVKFDFIYEGEVLNTDDTPRISEIALETKSVANGSTVTWDNIDVSDCEEYAVSIIAKPPLTSKCVLTSTAIGFDNTVIDEDIVLIDGVYSVKTSNRVAIKSPKITLKLTNTSTGSNTFMVKLIKFSNNSNSYNSTDTPAQQGSVKLIGKKEGDGSEGLAVSYVEDDNGLPVLRVVDSAPHGYDVATNSIRVTPISTPKVVIDTIANGVAIAKGATHTVGFLSKGEDETWVLINSDKTGWTATANVGMWSPYNSGANLSSALFPKRENVTTNTSSLNFPARSLVVNANNEPSIPYDTYERAYAHRNTSDNTIYVTNNHATDTSIVTIRIMRVWR